MFGGLLGDSSAEWSDSSYSLRRRYKLNWSAIIRNIPDDLELGPGLEETFSRWSVSQGYSLPSSVEIREEVCILKGIRRVLMISFPSRSSTRSFVKFSKRSIWEEISKDSVCELYVYCVPPFSFKPLFTMESMNVSTCYWLIRGISGEIGSEETFWDCIGRENRFGEHLRRVVYIRDERKTGAQFSSMGFCFLQFSSPLNSYRALRWQIRRGSTHKFSKPMLVGTRHIQAILTLVGKLDKYETRTLDKLREVLEGINSARFVSSKDAGDFGEYSILRSYLRFWTRSHSFSIPISKSVEFSFVGDDKGAKGSFVSTLSYCDPYFKVPGDLKLYYNRNLNIYWDWNSRIFLRIQNKAIFEFDHELSSLVCISDTNALSSDNGNLSIMGKHEQDEFGAQDGPTNIENAERERGGIFDINRKKNNKEREKLVASLIETARMQLSRSDSVGTAGGVLPNTVPPCSAKRDIYNFRDSELSSKRKLSEFFDTCCADDSQSGIKGAIDDSLRAKKANIECNHNAEEAPFGYNCGFPKDSSYLDSGDKDRNIDEDKIIDLEPLDSFDSQRVELEELVCFVCCRVFNSLKEKVSHEQNSLLHKYNLENSEP